MIEINEHNAKRYYDRLSGQLYEWNADTQTWDTVGSPGVVVKTWPLADVLAEGADGGGLVIGNIGDPTNLQDAATKAYVDARIAALVELFGAVNGAAASEFVFETLGDGVEDIEGLSVLVEFTWLTDAVGTT